LIKPVEVLFEDNERVIYQERNKLILAIKSEVGRGRVRTRRMKSVRFVPVDETDSMLNKDILYLDGSYEWQRGVVIGWQGNMLFVRKRELFDGTDLDKKEKVPIENVMGVVKEEGNGSGQ